MGARCRGLLYGAHHVLRWFDEEEVGARHQVDDRMRGREAHLIGWRALGMHVGTRREVSGAY